MMPCHHALAEARMTKLYDRTKELTQDEVERIML
jgi:hypothetical protein